MNEQMATVGGDDELERLLALEREAAERRNDGPDPRADERGDDGDHEPSPIGRRAGTARFRAQRPVEGALSLMDFLREIDDGDR